MTALEQTESNPLPSDATVVSVPQKFPIPSTFDLSTIETARWAWTRRLRIQTGLVGPVFGLLVILEFLSLAPPPLGSAHFFIYLAGGIVAAALLVALEGIMGPRAFRRGPQSLTVTNTGLELEYASGRKDTCSWGDPKFRMTVNDYRASPFPIRMAIPCDVSIGLLGLRQFGISGDATDAVIQAAKERAGSVFTRKVSVLGHWDYNWSIQGSPRAKPRPGWTRVN